MEWMGLFVDYEGNGRTGKTEGGGGTGRFQNTKALLFGYATASLRVLYSSFTAITCP